MKLYFSQTIICTSKNELSQNDALYCVNNLPDGQTIFDELLPILGTSQGQAKQLANLYYNQKDQRIKEILKIYSGLQNKIPGYENYKIEDSDIIFEIDPIAMHNLGINSEILALRVKCVYEKLDTESSIPIDVADCLAIGKEEYYIETINSIPATSGNLSSYNSMW